MVTDQFVSSSLGLGKYNMAKGSSEKGGDFNGLFNTTES